MRSVTHKHTTNTITLLCMLITHEYHPPKTNKKNTAFVCIPFVNVIYIVVSLREFTRFKHSIKYIYLLLAALFSVTDFQQVVSTPAQLLLGEWTARYPVNTAADLLAASFAATVLLLVCLYLLNKCLRMCYYTCFCCVCVLVCLCVFVCACMRNMITSYLFFFSFLFIKYVQASKRLVPEVLNLILHVLRLAAGTPIPDDVATYQFNNRSKLVALIL